MAKKAFSLYALSAWWDTERILKNLRSMCANTWIEEGVSVHDQRDFDGIHINRFLRGKDREEIEYVFGYPSETTDDEKYVDEAAIRLIWDDGYSNLSVRCGTQVTKEHLKKLLCDLRIMLRSPHDRLSQRVTLDLLGEEGWLQYKDLIKVNLGAKSAQVKIERILAEQGLVQDSESTGGSRW